MERNNKFCEEFRETKHLYILMSQGAKLYEGYEIEKAYEAIQKNCTGLFANVTYTLVDADTGEEKESSENKTYYLYVNGILRDKDKNYAKIRDYGEHFKKIYDRCMKQNKKCLIENVTLTERRNGEIWYKETII